MSKQPAKYTALYSYLGERIDGTAMDPWPAIAEKTNWVVDGGVPWEAAANREPEQNFILGQSAVSAACLPQNLPGSATAKSADNVFTIEVQLLSGRQVAVIDRLGSTLAYKCGWRTPTPGSSLQTDNAATSEAFDHKRQRVLAHAGREPKAMIAALQGMKTEALRNLSISSELALAAYALLLEESRQNPNRGPLGLFEQRDPAAFQAADLIQEALFLGAGIFSSDTTGAGRMAAFIEIPHRIR
ncbi:MAG TPA: hypothetical protein VNC50_05725 [Planctomycetia bacterium]|nr:hypothetical protein [Planctomycetia bacterium]